MGITPHGLIIYMRSNPPLGFTQAMGVSYSLLKVCFNLINITSTVNFPPLDTVHKNIQIKGSAKLKIVQNTVC